MVQTSLGYDENGMEKNLGREFWKKCSQKYAQKGNHNDTERRTQNVVSYELQFQESKG
jgi:hypothetical protein